MRLLGSDAFTSRAGRRRRPPRGAGCFGCSQRRIISHRRLLARRNPVLRRFDDNKEQQSAGCSPRCFSLFRYKTARANTAPEPARFDALLAGFPSSQDTANPLSCQYRVIQITIPFRQIVLGCLRMIRVCGPLIRRGYHLLWRAPRRHLVRRGPHRPERSGG